jgi:hypothetical protein
VSFSGAAENTVPTFLRAMLPKRWMQAIEEHPLLASLLPLVQQSAIYLMGAALVGLGNFVLGAVVHAVFVGGRVRGVRAGGD